ncbi:MAG TPA: hypothetical protein VG798_05860 [Rhizomicrobium sp.]|nr:hypothetical protein [Rhizomicrobium sp.]
MKKTGILLAALAGLAMAGCAGRYYADDYRDGYYHGHPPGNAGWHDRDRYRDTDRYDRDRYDRDRYDGDRYDGDRY